jgi:acetoacetyl-CoA synthetase
MSEMQAKVLWSPPGDAFDTSAMARFARASGFEPRDYNALHNWSICEKGAFWGALWDFAGVLPKRARSTSRQTPLRR